MTQQKALAPIDALKGTVKQMAPQFQAALPKHITVEKFNRVLLTAITQTPALVDCDRASFFAACLRSAQEGLLPDGKESALVPYGNKITYIPMIAGILKKVRNSGELATITAQIIHKNDAFKYWVDGDGEHLNHEPNLFSDRGEVIGTYAIAKTKDGAFYIEVMTSAQILPIKNKAPRGGPWSGPYEHEMWKKTVLKRLSKRLPMSTDLEASLHDDEDQQNHEQINQPQQTQAAITHEEKDVEPAVKPDRTKPSKLAGVIKNQATANDNNVQNEQDVTPGDEEIQL